MNTPASLASTLPRFSFPLLVFFLLSSLSPEHLFIRPWVPRAVIHQFLLIFSVGRCAFEEWFFYTSNAPRHFCSIILKFVQSCARGCAGLPGGVYSGWCSFWEGGAVGDALYINLESFTFAFGHLVNLQKYREGKYLLQEFLAYSDILTESPTD